jgi:hypothetical protein
MPSLQADGDAACGGWYMDFVDSSNTLGHPEFFSITLGFHGP